MDKKLEPIAVIGIGAIMPGALNKDEFWQNIIQGKNCITEVPKEKWDSSLFYSADRTQPDKTYSKIGGFITGYKFNSLKYKIPPAVAKQMDTIQQLALDIAQMALEDSGYDKKDFDRTRTSVIVANSVGGMKNEFTNVRLYKALYIDMLKNGSSFKNLTQETKDEILKELETSVDEKFLPVNEDTMPGELANVLAGRIANVLNLGGANFAIDAACASSLAALDQALNGLRAGEYDMAFCGGVDQMMSPASYIRFCKIGALSDSGSYAFDARANGFVMAEGAGMVLLKRLSDAVKDGDKIYGVIRAVGSSSDGKGKGITAPNPKGQMLAINRAFEQVDFDPSQVGLMEAHGTATKVGDATELAALNEVFSPYAKVGTIGLGSVKSQIGHTKSAAGMASLIKVMLALYNKVLPPSINFETPNPIVDWSKSPFKVITQAKEWQSDKVRTADVSAFGFGGANFHLIAQEYDPSKNDFKQEQAKTICVSQEKEMTDIKTDYKLMVPVEKLQGDMLIFSGDTKQELFNNLNEVVHSIKQENSFLTLLAYKTHTEKHKKFAVSINAENPDKLKEKIAFFIKTANGSDVWADPSLYLKMKGIYPFNPTTDKPKVCFMFPGQGAQYVDMMKDLASKYKIVRDTFAQADKILKEIIGSTLTDTLWSKEGETKEEYKKREEAIKQTQITQPAILTCNVAMMRLLYQFGLKPDVTMGHSLGEYGAAVASGILNFEDAIKAVTIRGSVMANIELEDTGKMAAVSASVETIEPELAKISGYVAVANKNCPTQTVIAGESKSVEDAVNLFNSLGIQAVEIPVSHAFHSKMVAPVMPSYRKFLDTLDVKAPTLPITSNVSADFYPTEIEKIKDIMTTQIMSSVEWVKQVELAYKRGVRLFIECGPKRVLSAFVLNTLADKKDIRVLASNHPKRGGITEFNDLMANLAAAGISVDWSKTDVTKEDTIFTPCFTEALNLPKPKEEKLFDLNTLKEKFGVIKPAEEKVVLKADQIVVSGVGAKIFGSSMEEVLHGKSLIKELSQTEKEKQLEKNIIFKGERINSPEQVIKNSAPKIAFDFEKETGISAEIAKTFNDTTKMAITSALSALKDAGITLNNFALPENMANDTGIIFASSLPTASTWVYEVSTKVADILKGKTKKEVRAFYDSFINKISDDTLRNQVQTWYEENFAKYEMHTPRTFTQDFLTKALPLAHIQLANLIGAKGPVLHITGSGICVEQAISLAQDWLKLGKVNRVLVISADEPSNEYLQDWLYAGFLAKGQNKVVLGSAASAFVLEKSQDVLARNKQPLTKVLVSDFATVSSNNQETLINLLTGIFDKAGLNKEQIAKDLLIIPNAEVLEDISFLKQLFGTGAVKLGDYQKLTACSFSSGLEEILAISALNTENKKYVLRISGGFNSLAACLQEKVSVDTIADTPKQEPKPEVKKEEPKVEPVKTEPVKTEEPAKVETPKVESNKQISEEELTKEIVDIVAQKTGYPQDMLELDLDMEADLGIDTVKQAELFALFGEKYNLPLNQGLQLKDYPPIRHCIKYVLKETGNNSAETKAEHKPEVKKEEPKVEPVKAEPVKTVEPAKVETPKVENKQISEEELTKEIVDIVAQKTGYPQDMLELDLDMEADLGIDTVKQAELFALFGEKYNLPLNQGLQLKDYPTIRHCIKYVLKETGNNSAETKAEPKPEVKKEEPKVEPVKTEPVKAEEPAKVETPKVENKQISEEELTKEIVDIVAQKTGYPQDMLELDLDMEADLGIDTVKQAELFALFGEKYNLPLNQGLQLKDYPTIRHCIKYVLKETGNAKTAEVKAEPKPEVKKEEPIKAEMQETPKAEEKPIVEKAEPKQEENLVEKQQATKEVGEDIKLRFVPVTAQAPLTPLKPRKLSAQRVVLIMSDNASITKAYVDAFKEQGIRTHIFTTLRSRTKNTTIVNWDSLEETISTFKEFAAANPLSVQGIIYALPCSLKKFDKRVNPNTELTKNLMPLFNACKIFINDLSKRDDAETFVAVISKIDGNFGYKTREPLNPIIGAVYGGASCFRKDLYEIAGVLTKIIDFREDVNPEQMAQQTIGEVLTGDERGLISFDGLERKTVLCLPRKVNRDFKRMDLTGKTIAFTGAARGIGAILAQKIAKEYQTRILILDIIEMPEKTSYYATLSEQDLAALKQELWQKLKADTTVKATPVLLEKEFAKIKDAANLYKNIEKLKALGSEVEYYQCDVTNSSMLKDVVTKIKHKYGKLDGLIHFAGLEHSKLLTDKTIEEYYKIFGVKATSAAAFLALNLVKESGFYAFASSIAGKFGNLGQSDYASASDYLAKLALSLHRQGQRAVSIAMSAYSKVGMGIRPGVFDFLTKQGLKFVDPEVGMQIFLDEIVYGKVPEIILTDDLGALDSDKQICFNEPNIEEEEIEEEEETTEKENNSGDDNNTNNTSSTPIQNQEPAQNQSEGELFSLQEESTQEKTLVKEETSKQEEIAEKQESLQEENKSSDKDNFFLGEIVSLIKNQEVFAKKTYKADWTFLKDHSINGTPYVPGVIGIESFAEAAKVLGQNIKGFQDVHFSLPIKLLRLRDQEVMIKAKNEQSLISFTLESDFISSRGIKMGSTRRHFDAKGLTHYESNWQNVKDTIDFDNLIKSASNYRFKQEEIYQGMFHGPSFKVLDGIIQADGDQVLSVYQKPQVPLFDDGEKDLLACPLLIEAAFQTCGYRDILVENRITLPDYIGTIALNFTDKPKDNLFVLAQYTGKNIEGKSIFNAFVFDETGKLWVELSEYQMIGQ